MRHQLEIQLNQLGTPVSVSENTLLFSEGDVCSSFLIVKSGQIKVFKLSDRGREFVLYRVNPENLCVLTTSCILAGTVYPANGMSETKVEAITLSKEAFDKLILNSKDFRELVFSSLSTRMTDFIEKIDEVVFHTLRDRLWDYLLKTNKSHLETTHQDLAQELGTEREVISRILKQFEREGRLKLTKGEIIMTPKES